MIPVWLHYFSRRGTPKDLREFRLDGNLRRHPNVRRAVDQFRRSILEEGVSSARRTCGRNSNRKGFEALLRHRMELKVNVNSDPDLTLVGRGTLICEGFFDIEINCENRVFAIEGKLPVRLRDAFIDVLDLRSTTPGNSEIPGGKGFDLRHRWTERINLRNIRF
jgi:hypothetical protein